MNSKSILYALFCLAMSVNHSILAQEIDQSIARELGLVKQTRQPLRSGVFDIDLNLGKRMELVFPEQGSLSLKVGDQDKFEILNVNASLFITLLVEIDKPVTAIFTLSRSQQIIVLNLRSVEASILVTSRSIQPPQSALEQQTQAQKIVPPLPGPSQVKGYDYDRYVELTAFAARTAYAPDRLLQAPKGVRQLELRAHKRQVQKISREHRLTLKPLSSWVHRGLHITVLEIENIGDETLALTADVLRGQFVSRSFQHHRIGITDQDRYSAAYVISLLPFHKAIEAL